MRALLLAVVLGVPSIGEAHIHLVNPLSRTDMQTGDQKEQHCGVLNQVRNPARVTTFKPGETIMVTWMETINHPGWFRIAFQPNGDIFGIPPASNGAPANFPTENRTGMVDPANGSIVLADRIADGTLSMNVTLPNMQCTNCTLQFIQVMTDGAPYTTDVASNDIYFNCADVTLAGGAPDAGTVATPDAGTGTVTEPDAGGGNYDNGAITGGCSTGSTMGLPFALALLGLRRKRRAR